MAPTLLITQLHWAMQEAACELLSDLDFVDSFVAENCKRIASAYDVVTGVLHGPGLRPEAHFLTALLLPMRDWHPAVCLRLAYYSALQMLVIMA